MVLFKLIRDYIDTLVHPSARHDALTASRHRAFIAPRLLGSIAALAALPLYIVMRGVPGALEVMVFGWLVLPILTAYYLSRTGRYESAHILSALALTGLVTAVAAATGGIASFAAIWLVLVPLEAALSASRRIIASASGFALAAAGVLLLLGAAGYALAIPAVRVRGAEFDVNALLFSSLFVMLGYQSILFAFLTKAFAVTAGMLPTTRSVQRFFEIFNLERGLVAGTVITLLGAGMLAAVLWRWWAAGFGPLDYRFTLRLSIPGVMLAGLGVQTILSSFFASILGLRRT